MSDAKGLPAALQPVGPLMGGSHDYESITASVADIVLERPQPKIWWPLFFLSAALLGVLTVSTGWLFWEGIGVWGVNHPVGWGFAIVNLVWWIGIGHAGTLISAILHLFEQSWRTAINRFAEAMTLFAVSCAGLFPLLHVGRPWVIFFILPYLNTMALWPQFRSPLLWDVFAISTYATVSLLFWFTGLLPDLATLRDRSKGLPRIVYGIFAMGWRGSARHWYRYEMAYLLFAGLSTPLVVSVHSIVSLDFAAGIVPGWHATIFPPYFVAGAIYSGFAMVLTILIPVRKLYGLEDFITLRHLDLMAKVMLATGLIVLFGYGSELFYGLLYAGSEYETFMMWNRMTGPYGWAYTMLIVCNGVFLQFLWSKRIRTTPVILFGLSIVVNIGMWLERYVIVVVSLTRDYLPSSWGAYDATLFDWAAYLGSIGLFLFMICLFVRFLPMINIFEMRHLKHHLEHDAP
ncbi:MAG: NrfD/PsrC family molybdoenzyme membrane anchor subunit [Candidatus Hydrogenedentota bacterium]